MWHRIDDPDHPPPKDGTRILLYQQGEMIVGFWNGRSWDDGDFFDDMGNDFTHWMLLPPPPAEDTP